MFFVLLEMAARKVKKKRRILVFVLPGMTDRESENKNTKIFFLSLPGMTQGSEN